MCPGSERYELGSPLFKEVRIHLHPDYHSGKSFTIQAKNNAPNHPYVQSVLLNEEKLERSYIYHSEIIQGGTLLFNMGPKPNLNYPKSM